MTNHFQIMIDALGAQGDGLATMPDGRHAFVPGVLPSETADVSIRDEKPDGVFCAVHSIVTPSPDRAVPPCAHFDRCGGCALQHMNADFYARFKMDLVAKALARHGLVPGMIGGPFISPPQTRRRAVLAAYRSPEKTVLGFNERRSKRIVDLQSCAVLLPRLQSLIAPLRDVAASILHPGQGMDIVMVAGDNDTVDLLFQPWVKKARTHVRHGRGKKKADGPEYRILAALSEFAGECDIARLYWQNSAENPHDLTLVLERNLFVVSLGGVAVRPPPGAFLQATKEGERALTGAVLAGVAGAGNVADLYAGCGTFAFALMNAGHHVSAVEGFRPAVDALSLAARMDARNMIVAEHRDLADEPLSARELKSFDAIVIDPPRLGAKEQMAEIAKSDVRTVASVSCNPASFARDGEILTNAGFRLENLCVVDQFLWSPHIELAGVFKR